MRKTQDLSLYWTPQHFILDGNPIRGLPIFIRSKSMKIEYLPTEFCIHTATIRARAQSSKTWRQYGYAIRGFIESMESRNLDWRQPTEEYLAGYRSKLTQAGLGNPRVRRVMSILCAFYEWAHSKGFIKTLPFTREALLIPNRGMLAHTQRSILTSRPVLIPKAKRSRRHPRYFTREEQERMYAALGERDRLILEWALYTGLREFEIAWLTIDMLPVQSSYISRRAYPIPVLGKGGVWADAFVPTWLLKRTAQHIRFFGRQEVVRSTLRRGKSPAQAIFLARWGDGLKPDSIYRNITNVMKSLGIKGTFHHLRHTYAISMLHKLMRQKRHASSDGVNALLELRDLMRHASLSSTQIYLEARNYYLTEIYDDLYQLPARYS